MPELANKKISNEEFSQIRHEVLQAWPTGKAVNLQEAVEYANSIPVEQQFPNSLKKALKEKTTLIQPRAGVPELEKLVELLKILHEKGQADLLPVTIDSYTRQNRYTEAETGLEKSRLLGKALLNGFPAVNYGVKGCREVVEKVKVPLQVRHGTPDSRLLAEITFAGGLSSFEGGAITYNIPYAKDISLLDTIRYWQYVDRLVGWYGENGVTINRESFGPLSGTLIPPCISISIGILELLLAAEQGVKDFTIGYAQGGNIAQDIAAVQVMEDLAKEYLQEFGYEEVQVSTVFHQWMGAFPPDQGAALGVIALGGMVAAAAEATKIITKTPDEAVGIPTAEANVLGLRTTRQALTLTHGQSLGNLEIIKLEKTILEKEVHQLIHSVFTLGEGDLALGVVRGFAAGVLDIPFAPSRQTKGSILPIRDSMGAIRILEFGALPFTEEIKKFHTEQINIRCRKERRSASYDMVVDDILGIALGKSLVY